MAQNTQLKPENDDMTHAHKTNLLSVHRWNINDSVAFIHWNLALAWRALSLLANPETKNDDTKAIACHRQAHFWMITVENPF